MDLVLILLFSTAFGQQLDDLLNNSELFEKVSESLEEPEKSILEAALDPSSALIDFGAEGRLFDELTHSHPELSHVFRGERSAFMEAKSYLRNSRLEIISLAYRIFSEVRDLKIALGASFRVRINRMKDLVLETLEKLEAAKENYLSAMEAFDDVNNNIKAIGRRNGMLESGNNFDKTIKVVIDILHKEIVLIDGLSQSARVVSNNIDRYPLEYLWQYKSIKTIFIRGLDRLENAAVTFLTQHHVRQYALDIYRQYLDQQNALRRERERERANVGKNLLEAERNILAVSALKHAVEDQYFPAYNEAK